MQVVANKLRDPRGLAFDSAGGLLVVEQGHGISRLSLTGDGACVRQNGATQSVIENDQVRVRDIYNEIVTTKFLDLS